MRGQVLTSVMIDMRWSVIHNQMNSARPRPSSGDLTQRPQEMFMVIGLQATGPHRPIKHLKCDQHHHRAMSFVLELTSRYLPGSHRLRRLQTRERLNVWFLIYTDDEFTALIQPPNPLVAPQNLRRSGGEFFINRSCLPVATAMRLQTGRSQNTSHGRVVNRINDRLLNHHLLEGATVPTGHVPPIGAWVSAGYAFDLDSLERGKKWAAA